MKHRFLTITHLTLFFLVVFFSYTKNLSAQPQFNWAQKVDGYSFIASQLIDQAGNIYCSGGFSGLKDFDNSFAGTFFMSAEDGNAFVMKLTASGNFLWAIQFQVQHSPKLAIDAAENLYISGNTHETKLLDLDPGPGEVWHENNLPGLADIFVVKLDANGAYVWGKAMGSDYLDNVFNVETDPVNGGVYIEGTFYGSGDFDPGPDTFILQSPSPGFSYSYILRLDNEGQFVWAYSFKSTLTDIETNNNSGLFVTGNFRDTVDFDPGVGIFELTSDSYCGFILKLSSEGTFQWVRKVAYPMSQPSDCSIYELAFDNSGNMFLAGNYNGEIDFDSGPDNYMLPFTQGNYQTYILKLEPTGEFIWAIGYSYPTTTNIYTSILRADLYGNVYVSGQFWGALDFDAGPEQFNLTSADQFSDAYILKLLPDGQFDWSFQISGTDSDYCSGLNIDNNQQLIASGGFGGSADFDPGPGVNILTGHTYGSGFLAKYTETGSAVFQPELLETFSVSPNPASDWIQTPAEVDGEAFTIYNELGMLSGKGMLPAQNGPIYIGDLPNGNYTICVEGEKKRQVGKFIKLRG